jgi:galactose mutarotase-like enzyme
VTTPSSWIRLHSDALDVAIDPQGAQLSVLRDAAGNDLLWNGDPAVWKGRAPILFPIVGALNGGHYHWCHQRFALPRHGFARDRSFDVVSSNARAALLRQSGDSTTHSRYPFAFELDVAFAVAGTRLTTIATVRNNGEIALPASLGFHPALRWPLPFGAARDAHYLEFEHDEPAPIRRLNGAGLLMAQSFPTPVRGRRLLLEDALFVDDVVIFDQCNSRSLTYGAGTGPRIKVEFPDATYLGLWSKPGAPFICIEPWRGVADPVDFAGEFSDKPGVMLVPPGGTGQLAMSLELLAPATQR